MPGASEPLQSWVFLPCPLNVVVEKLLNRDAKPFEVDRVKASISSARVIATCINSALKALLLGSIDMYLWQERHHVAAHHKHCPPL